ncbi:hypothetical protein ACI6PS_05395 [Flavobacterium sp. PLA-1-15]|uniref:hypothetical protein n=1 Tax=Flavobacterium sp. PLA-1-15 TaxID=3380533 RepID=UPI003B7A74F1
MSLSREYNKIYKNLQVDDLQVFYWSFGNVSKGQMIFPLALMEPLSELLNCLIRQGKASGSSRKMDSKKPERFASTNF